MASRAPSPAMPRPSHPRPVIRVIRFTTRLARECARGDARLAERAVCDAIANGSRRPTGRRGPGGGRIIRFEKTFGRAPDGGEAPRPATVAVLGELVRGGCVALRLLTPAPESGAIRDF